jgi:hypothetical protein
MSEPALPARALRLVDGAPDVSFLPCDRLLAEGGAEYMRRFYLRRGPSGRQARFHLISASDPGRDFHDHPWDYVSHLLSGAYIEHTPDGDVRYEAPCMLIRKAESLHRLELADGPVWTYFVTGRFRRTWGFTTAGGWVAFTDYAEAGTLAGCGPGRGW